MPVQNFSIAYPDFKMGEKINPEEFDSNNKAIVDKVNEVIGVLNDEKTDLFGDHKGTWQGLTPSSAAAESINGSRLDALEPRVITLEASVSGNNIAIDSRTTRLEGISQNMQKEVANLALKQEAGQRVVNGHTFGTDFTSTFNMTIPSTGTTVSSAVANGSALINVVSSVGFVVGDKVFIFDDVNYDFVTISSINGNSIAINAVTHAYAVGANFSKSMIDTSGYFKGFNKLEEGFESALVNWSVVGTNSFDTAWKTEGTRSYKMTGQTGGNQARITKSFDLTNVSYLIFDFNCPGSWVQNESNSSSTPFYISIDDFNIAFAPGVTPSSRTISNYSIDVRHYSGTHQIIFTMNSYFNQGTGSSENASINIDNLRFTTSPPKAEFFIQLGSTDDVVAWIEGKAGMTFTGLLGSTTMTKTVEGVQTQLYAEQTLGSALLRITAEGTAGTLKKVDKILGGYA